jgi:hypothetical protein
MYLPYADAEENIIRKRYKIMLRKDEKTAVIEANRTHESQLQLMQVRKIW